MYKILGLLNCGIVVRELKFLSSNPDHDGLMCPFFGPLSL